MTTRGGARDDEEAAENGGCRRVGLLVLTRGVAGPPAAPRRPPRPARAARLRLAKRCAGWRARARRSRGGRDLRPPATPSPRLSRRRTFSRGSYEWKESACWPTLSTCRSRLTSLLLAAASVAEAPAPAAGDVAPPRADSLLVSLRASNQLENRRPPPSGSTRRPRLEPGVRCAVRGAVAPRDK